MHKQAYRTSNNNKQKESKIIKQLRHNKTFRHMHVEAYGKVFAVIQIFNRWQENTQK